MIRQWAKRGAELLDQIACTKACDGETAVWYIGQCGFVVKKKHVFYIDPVLADIKDASGASDRLYPAPFAPREAYADYVICTHRHKDHFQEETIHGIYEQNPGVKYIVPGICRRSLLEWGIGENNIIEARQHVPIILDEVTVTPVSTAHPNHKTEADGTEWDLAYDMDMGGVHILHLGDTLLTEQLLCDLKTLPKPDLLLVPINGTDYFRTQNKIVGNMSEREAAGLAVELGAEITVPMHFDMIRGNTANPVHFIEALWELDSRKKFILPVLGERIMCTGGNRCV